MRTYVYIDGFNLYRGALKDSVYRWLDLKVLLQKTLPKESKLLKINYYTARVMNTPDNPSITNRQDIYLRALKVYIPEIDIHEGKFKRKKKHVPLVHPTDTEEKAYVRLYEEKRTDVNIATHILNDAWKDRYDIAYLLSTDSDLYEAIRLVTYERKKQIGLIIPTRRGIPKELSPFAQHIRHITTTALAQSQLPAQIPGTRIHKPNEWHDE
ncbi:MAG: NYN domain-containing protein [Pseudomonadales bacterium]